MLLWILIFAASVVIGFIVAPDGFDVGVQLVVHVAGLPATVAAGSIAFAMAPFINNRMQGTTSLGVGLALGLFLIDPVSKMTEKLDPLKYVSVHYFAGLADAAAGNPWPGGMLVLLLVFVVGTGLGYVFLNRKEFTDQGAQGGRVLSPRCLRRTVLWLR